MTLHARDVRWDRGGTLVVDGVTLTPRPGSTVGLLGPNGSGKSSLLRLLAGVVRPTSGVVTLDGTDLASLPRRQVARSTAVVAQQSATDVDLRVRDVVALGRVPHRTGLGGAFGGSRAADEEAVDRALARTGLSEKADRSWHRLSGGEQQRVHIARALAQEPRELLLDEPTNHLDVRHQLDLLDLVTRLPLTSVVALHDLNLAAMFCDELLVLRAGRAVAAGTPAEVLTTELVADVYGVRAQVDVDPDTGRPTVRFRPGAVLPRVSPAGTTPAPDPGPSPCR